ncbi:MAG TPA: DUF885 domain-containing protein [Gemmatimonadaceae bacterium]|nr:DUF885 domain-containing protein [Gemmatimonadaceae bacterium]
MRPTLPLAAALLAAACASSGGAPAARQAAATPDAAAARVTALADTFVAAYLDRFPEVVTFNGIPGGRHDRLSDNSLDALRRWEAREDAWLAEVRRTDPAPLAGRTEWVTYGILREALEASVGVRVCRGELWGVSQIAGWQINLPQLAGTQPVGTAELRAQALARWRTFPRFVDTEIANLREGVRQGYTVPRHNVELVIEQVDGLLSPPTRESPFYAMAAQDSAPGAEAFRADVERLVAADINPALARYRDYLRREYLPVARSTIAVSAIPNGAACYRALVRQFATVDVPPDEIHRVGLQQMAKIEGEMAEIARRSFGTSDVRAVLDRLKTDPQYTFKSREEVIAYSRAAVERAQRAAPRWFGILPKARVVIERYPEYRERSASGEYWPPAEDGSRPGTFYISTYEPTKRSRSGPESVAFHETVPGHHLQGAIALERGSATHPIARYLSNSGYAEGWALYAERLADEMGLFSSDLDRMGMLSEQAYRAARLVIDPGIHSLGWTREQAIEYMASHTTAPRDEVISEIDRYIIWPGQATSYMLGMLEIRRLRDQAERELGPKFDIRAFHDRILENGAVPLPLLRDAVGRWVERTPQ